MCTGYSSPVNTMSCARFTQTAKPEPGDINQDSISNPTYESDGEESDESPTFAGATQELPSEPPPSSLFKVKSLNMPSTGATLASVYHTDRVLYAKITSLLACFPIPLIIKDQRVFTLVWLGQTRLSCVDVRDRRNRVECRSRVSECQRAEAAWD